MTASDSDPRCLLCRPARAVDGHHVAGQANVRTAIVPLCVDCHPGQTEQQRTAGVALDTRPHPDPAETLWAVVSGFVALISTWSANFDEQARLPEPGLIALARAVVDEQRADELASVGPDPIANARRRCERARRRRRQRRTSGEPATELDDVAVFIATLVRAISNAAHELLGEAATSSPYLCSLRSAAERPEVLAARLGEIAGMADADLGRIAREDDELLQAMLAGLTAAVVTGQVDDQLAALVQRMAEREAAYLRLLTGLSDPTGRPRAQAALERFLEESRLSQ